VNRNLGIALLRAQVYFEPEQLEGKDLQTRSDFRIALRNAQAQAFGVQRTVAHEVADELG